MLCVCTCTCTCTFPSTMQAVVRVCACMCMCNLMCNKVITLGMSGNPCWTRGEIEWIFLGKPGIVLELSKWITCMPGTNPTRTHTEQGLIQPPVHLAPRRVQIGLYRLGLFRPYLPSIQVSRTVQCLMVQPQISPARENLESESESNHDAKAGPYYTHGLCAHKWCFALTICHQLFWTGSFKIYNVVHFG